MRPMQFVFAAITFACCVLNFGVARAESFSFQGYLTQHGAPAAGAFNIRFRLLDDPSAGTQIGDTLIAPNWTVADGVFTCSLDFGANVFASSTPRWLEIAIAPAGSASYQVLSPRQRLQAAPKALALEWPQVASAASVQPVLALSNASSGAVLDATNSGSGPALRATINNPNSATNALIATTNGSGRVLHAQTTGAGPAALIRNTNPANTQTALTVTTNGNGSAAKFEALKSDGTQPAVRIRQVGDGPALVCEAASSDARAVDVQGEVTVAGALDVDGPLTLRGTSACFSVIGQQGQYGFIPLDHPLLNDNPTAVVFVQPRENVLFNSGPTAAGARYVAHEGRWRIDAYGGGVHLRGFRYDVLIFLRD